MELSIAKEKYDYSDKVKESLPYEKWTNFIDSNSDYYEWLENTDRGRERLANIDRIPDDFREGILEQLNKTQAFAEFNQKKGWYEIVIDFHRDTGVIKTTFMKKITKSHLRKLLDMANYLDGFLLNNGTEIIDDNYVI